jgi:hypothetical protein
MPHRRTLDCGGRTVYRADMPTKPRDTDIDALIGENLKTLRLRAGLSGGALVDLINAKAGLGWGDGVISRIEAGGRRLRIAEVAVLCDVLQVGVSALLEGDSPLAEPFQAWTGNQLAAAMTTKSSKPRVNPVLEASEAAAEARGARLLADLERTVVQALATGKESEQQIDLLYEWVRMQSQKRWGHDLLTERDYRVTDEALELHERGIPSGDKAYSRLRAWATRGLIAELKAAR